ncbi:Short coiled-coil protein B [Halotydeus destructor]|nr:Short coiled-coil protein B [Halotydeus destructor]
MAEGLKSIQEDLHNIPLADDDETQEVDETIDHVKPADKLPTNLVVDKSTGLANHVQLPVMSDAATSMTPTVENSTLEHFESMSNGRDSLEEPESLDPCDFGPDEAEERERLIQQVLELQNTLDDLSQRVDSVKDENHKLKSENSVLSQYIENLMTASSVFQSTSTKK